MPEQAKKKKVRKRPVKTGPKQRGDGMSSYIDPKLRTHFESLSIDLKNEILKQDVKLYTLNDLIKCLESIVKE